MLIKVRSPEGLVLHVSGADEGYDLLSPGAVVLYLTWKQHEKLS